MRCLKGLYTKGNLERVAKRFLSTVEGFRGADVAPAAQEDPYGAPEDDDAFGGQAEKSSG